MRNLLGRLDARSLEELLLIAQAWQIPATAPDRAGLVGSIYREMRDPRTVRDFWQQVSQPERDLIALLVVAEQSPDTALTLAEIAKALDVDEEAARQTAIALFRIGVVAREGDRDELPVGVPPHLFVPRELATSFERLFDEIGAGDSSALDLNTLLSRLDLVDLETAAGAWGYQLLPGLRGEDELRRIIADLMLEPGRITSTVARMPDAAQEVWRRILEDSTRTRVPVADAVPADSNSTMDVERRAKFRTILGELESSLLLCHTWLPDRSRWLFIPAALRDPSDVQETQASRPAVAQSVDPSAEPARDVPYALAWDLLTVLRAINDPTRAPVRETAKLSRRWLRELNSRLWNRGAEAPPEGYLEFLLSLASGEGLIGTDSGRARVVVANAIQHWQTRSFAEQTAHLAWWWLASPEWIEGENANDVVVQGANWPGFRRTLLAKLAALDANWYDLDALTEWLAEEDPEMLGPAAVAATARMYDPSGDEFGRRKAAVMAASNQTILTAARWFGLVEAGRNAEGWIAIRPTTMIQALLSERDLPGTQAESSLQIDNDHVVELENASPTLVWSLSAFADLEQADQITRYRINQPSARRAAAAGHSVAQIASFLERNVDRPLPQLRDQLSIWMRDYRLVEVRAGARLLARDPAHLSSIGSQLRERGWRTWNDNDSVWVEFSEGESSQAGEQRLSDDLTSLGFHANAPQQPLEGGGGGPEA